MNKKDPRITIIVVLCCCAILLPPAQVRSNAYRPLPSTAAAAPVPLDFYRSLAGAIDSVDGHLTINLNRTSNRWRTAVTGTHDLEWRYSSAAPPGFTPLMEVFFKYNNGALQEGAEASYVEFRPEVVLTLLPTEQMVGVVVTKIIFDARGYPTRYEGEAQTDAAIKSWDQNLNTKVAEHLRFALRPGTLFSDGPFRWASNPLDPGGSGPFLRRMSLTNSVADQARGGLEVTLKENSEVTFSRPQSGFNAFENAVTLAEPSQFLFSSLGYDFQTRQLQGAIAKFDLTLRQGSLNNEGLNLRLDEASRLFFENVEFRDSPAGPSSLRATDGELKGGVSLGSRIVLAGGARETYFSPDTRSTVALDSLSLEMSGQNSSITVGSDSKLDFFLVGGRLLLVSTDHVLIKSGRVLVENLAGTWARGLNPSASGNVGLLLSEISAGVFSMIPGRGINLRGGTIEGRNLRLNGAASPVITGSFSNVVFDIEDGTTLEIPNRFLIIARSATRFTANDAARPFAINAGQTTASGQFRAIIPFWTCFMPPAGSPAIRDSMLRSTLILNGSGGVDGTDEVVDYTCCRTN